MKNACWIGHRLFVILVLIAAVTTALLAH